MTDDWARWFLILGSAFGLALALFLPPLSGIDETAHYLRVDTIAHGWIVAPPAHKTPAGYTIDGCDAAFVRASQWSILDVKDRTEPTRRVPWSSQFTNPRCGKEAPARAVDGGLLRRAEPYSPVAYVPALAGYTVGSAVAGSVGGFYGARLLQLVCYLVLVALAIAIAPFGKPLLCAVGLVPINLQNAATISADPLTIATALLLGALVCRAAVDRRGPLALIAALAIVVGLLKSPYAPLAAMVVFLPEGLFGTLRRKVRYVAATLAAAASAMIGWSLLVRSSIDMPPLGSTGQLGTADAQRWIGDHPLGFVHLVVAQFTSMDALRRLLATAYFPIHTDALARVPLGRALVAACIVLLVVIRVLEPRTSGTLDWRRPLGAAGLAVASVALISYGMALSGLLAPHLLDGFQGRYLFPLVPLALVFVDPKRLRKPRMSQLRWVPGFCTAMLGIWCLVTWRAFRPLM